MYKQREIEEEKLIEQLESKTINYATKVISMEEPQAIHKQGRATRTGNASIDRLLDPTNSNVPDYVKESIIKSMQQGIPFDKIKLYNIYTKQAIDVDTTAVEAIAFLKQNGYSVNEIKETGKTGQGTGEDNSWMIDCLNRGYR